MKRQYRVKGLWARLMQHEVDHLNGVLISDYEESDADRIGREKAP